MLLGPKMSERGPEQQRGNTPSEYKTISVRGVGFAPTKTADLVKGPDGNESLLPDESRSTDRKHSRQDSYAVALRFIVELPLNASAKRMRQIAEDALAEIKPDQISAEDAIDSPRGEAGDV